jgi:hypothetical protein
VIITDTKKLATIETWIELARSAARADANGPEAQSLAVLRSLASDIRARMYAPKSRVLVDIERRVEAVSASKTEEGYNVGRMVALAAEVMANWPTIRQALAMQIGALDDDEATTG